MLADVIRSGMNTYVGFLAVVGEIHLIDTPLAGEILHLDRVVSLQRGTRVSQCKFDVECISLS